MNTTTVTNDVAVGHVLYFDSSTAMLRFDDQCMRLDHKTFQLMCYFVAHHDQIIERRALMNHLWKNQHASDASLGRLISVLRKILAVNGHKFIFTIHKTGYRFVIPSDVRFVATNPTVRKAPHSNVHNIDVKRSPEQLSQTAPVSQLAQPNQAEQPMQPITADGSNNNLSFANVTKANSASIADAVDTVENTVKSAIDGVIDSAIESAVKSAIESTVDGNAASNNPSHCESPSSKVQPQSQSQTGSTKQSDSKIRYWFALHFWVVLVILVGIYWDLGERQFNLSTNVADENVSEINVAPLNSMRIVILPFELLFEQANNQGTVSGNSSDNSRGNSSGDDDNLAFISGLPTEMINSLTKINGLQVIDKHNSSTYINNEVELSLIANNHSARFVLKGNVRMQQDIIRIAIQVIDNKNESVLLSSVYEHQASVGFDAQIDIATEVAEKLEQALLKTAL